MQWVLWQQTNLEAAVRNIQTCLSMKEEHNTGEKDGITGHQNITGQHGQNLDILNHLLHRFDPAWQGGRKEDAHLFPPFQNGSASCRSLWIIQQHSGCSQCLENYIIALSAFTELMKKGHTISWCKSVWLWWSRQKNTSSQYLMLSLSCQWWVEE